MESDVNVPAVDVPTRARVCVCVCVCVCVWILAGWLLAGQDANGIRHQTLALLEDWDPAVLAGWLLAGRDANGNTHGS